MFLVYLLWCSLALKAIVSTACLYLCNLIIQPKGLFSVIINDRLYAMPSQMEAERFRILKRINNSSSTADGPKQVDLDLEYEGKLVEIKKKYRDEFYKILPPEKVSILYKSEREFNDEALRVLSERSVRAGD